MSYVSDLFVLRRLAAREETRFAEAHARIAEQEWREFQPTFLEWRMRFGDPVDARYAQIELEGLRAS